MTAEAQNRERVEQIVRERLEPDWLLGLRLQALSAIGQSPEPEWERGEFRRSDVVLCPPTDDEPRTPKTIDLDEVFGRRDAKNRLVYANDWIAEHRIQPLIAKKGVVFTSLSMAVRLFPKLVRPYLGKVIPFDENKWVAIQTAFWNNGVFVYVPKKVRVALPLHVWWHRTVGGGRFHPRLLVVAEEMSDVTLVTGDLSELEEEAFSVAVTEVIAKQGATVRVTSLQEQAAQMTRLNVQRALVERGATVEWLYSDGSTGDTVSDVMSVLQEEGALTSMKALALGSRTQHLDLTMTAKHLGRYTESRIEGHGIVAQQAKTMFRLVSQVEKGAVYANAVQEGRMMLLDSTAKAHAVPTLLVAEEQGQCDHTLSVGTLPEEQLFYLMSRGLTEGEAKKVLLNGFLSPLMDIVSPQGVKKMLTEWLERKIRL